jgi:hypothetical protein
MLRMLIIIIIIIIIAIYPTLTCLIPEIPQKITLMSSPLVLLLYLAVEEEEEGSINNKITWCNGSSKWQIRDE